MIYFRWIPALITAAASMYLELGLWSILFVVCSGLLYINPVYEDEEE